MSDFNNHHESDTDVSKEVTSLFVENWGCTNLRVVKINYLWTITNFSYCQEKMGEMIKSPMFFSGENDEEKWCLRLNPKGLDDESKDYISLYLVLVSCRKTEIRARFRLSLVNTQGVETKAMESHKAYRFVYGKDWGFKKFIKRDFLFDDRNSILHDDKLTILCEVCIITDPTTVSGKIDKSKIEISKCTLKEDFERLYCSKKFSDVVISVNGHEFPAHKAILAARSQVFSAMFEHNMEEGQSNRVIITDVDSEVIGEMLHFIYSGKVNNLERNACDLMAVADKYDLKSLKSICEEFLCRNIFEENAAKVLVLADLHSSVELKSQAIAFITSKAKDVMKTDGWKIMVKSHPHIVAELFSVLASQEVIVRRPLFKRIKCK